MDEINKQRLIAHNLKGQGFTRAEIARQLGISERQVKRRLLSEYKPSLIYSGDIQEIQGKITSGTISSRTILGGSITSRRLGEPDILSQILDSKKSKTNIDEFFAEEDEELFPLDKDRRLFHNDEVNSQRDEVRKKIEDKYSGKEPKILYLADLHIPFTDYAAVSKIIKEHRDAEVLVLNGDVLDLFAVSKFAKDKEVAVRRELEEGRQFLESVCKKFADVIIIEGNHERRLRHFIKNIIPSDMQFLFPDDILQMVVDGTVLKKKPLVNAHVVGSWWFKLFDTIYAHPDNYSAANLKTVQNTSEHFSLVKNEWHRLCIIGHTHRAGWLLNGEVKLMETGCLCHDMDYHNGSKFTRTKWTKAYATVYYGKDNLADLNKSTVHLV